MTRTPRQSHLQELRSIYTRLDRLRATLHEAGKHDAADELDVAMRQVKFAIDVYIGE